jgi:hypothetical protein
MPSTSYCLGVEGNATFLRTTANALEGTLESFFLGNEWCEDKSLPLRVPQMRQIETVRAFGVVEAAGTLTLFVASCFAKKIFDEMYERLLKLPLKPFLDKIFGVGSPLESKNIDVCQSVFLEDINVLVVIRAEVSAETASSALALLLQGDRVAYAYIQAHGRKAPVHCHVISRGKVSVEPDLYISAAHLNSAHRANAKPG